MLSGEGGNFLRQLTAVKGFAVGAGNQLKRVRLRRVTEDLPHARGAAFRGETGAEARLIFQLVVAALPEMPNQRGDREAVARVVNGGLRQGGQRQRAEAFRQGDPAGYRPRHGHRVPADFGHRGFSGKQIRVPARRRTTGSVQAVQLFTVPDDSKGVAADAVAGRLDHRQRHGGGYGRINGIPPQLQHLHSRLRRQRLRRRNGIMAQHRRAA